MAASEPASAQIGTPLWSPENLAHVGYVVPKMERALSQWERSGAKLIIPPELDPIQNVVCSLLLVAGSFPIELVAPMPEGPNPVANRLSKGGGIDHVCIYVDDIVESVETFKEAGGICVVDPVYGAVFDRLIAFVMTRPGLVIELMERRPEGRRPVDPLRALNVWSS